MRRFGWALWTGAVVVVSVQVIPEAKRRQLRQALDAYQARAASGQASEDDQAPTAR